MGLVTRLTARVAELEAQVAELSRNSTNSSKPPSSDPPSVVRPPPTRSKRKRGGQPGHPGHRRRLLAPEKVSKTIDVLPDRCCSCGKHLHGRDLDPLRHQVVEVPPISPEVVEYRLHALGCDCGVTTRAQMPAGVPRSSFGPRLAAMLAICTAKYRLSKRAVRELLSDFLGIELSLGSVTNVEQQVSGAVDEPVVEAGEHVRKSSAGVDADETSWREN